MSDQGDTALTGALEERVEDYRAWLVNERSLAPSTVSYYVRAARLFLCEHDGRDLKSLTLGEVTDFVVRQCPRFSVGNAKNLVTGVRSLLGYLYVEGLTEHQLASAVPAPSGWRGANLPRGLGAVELAALLAGGGDASVVGRRDHAIVVLLARLGLRAGEVAALTLDDLDWSHGEIVVRGKGNRIERLPLPVDVGEAVVSYLHEGRPPGPVSLAVPADPRADGGAVVAGHLRCRAPRLRPSGRATSWCSSAASQCGDRDVAGRGVAGGGRPGAAPPQHPGHRPLRQGRLRCAPHAGVAVAG